MRLWAALGSGKAALLSREEKRQERPPPPRDAGREKDLPLLRREEREERGLGV